MTITIAVTGKSGSGKTTLAKAILKNLKQNYPEKSFLVIDNDLSGEFGHSFGHDIRNTIYGIRSGKHEYKTGIPSRMTRQEYVEWALQEILFPLDDETDLLVSWLVGSKDCRCPITTQLNDALLKLMNQYDFVLFDCEFDLKYLHQLVDCPIDAALIVAESTEEGVHLASRIKESSEKHAAGGQIGVVLNKVQNSGVSEVISNLLKKYNLDILGVLPYDTQLEKESAKKESNKIDGYIQELVYRLNLPPIK